MTWRVLDGAGASRTEADEAVARGVEQLLAGDEDAAAASFDRALARSPDHPEATYDRAVLAWDRGEVADDEVVRRLQAVRERHLCPERGAGRATWLLGLALNERGAPDRARAAFAKAARQGCADEAPAPAPSWFGAPSGRRARCLRTFSFPGRDARSVAVGPRSRRALVATSERLQLLDLDDLSVLGALSFDDTVECAAVFDGEQPLGFAGGLDRTVRVIDLESGESLRELEGHRRGVLCLAASPDGRRLATGSSDGALRVFDVASGACVTTLKDAGAVKVIAWNGPHDEVLAGGADGVLRCWSPGTGACLWTARHDGPVTGLAPHDGLIASTSLDGTLRLWAPDGTNVLRTSFGVALTCFALDPVSKRALLGTTDGAIRRYDVERGTHQGSLALHEGATSAVAIAAGGAFGLSAGEDAKVRLIELTRATEAPPLVLPRPGRAAARPVEVRVSSVTPAPGPAPVLADDWNDRGVWFFEQGSAQAARNAWSAALEVEPHHVEATYNLAVEAWDRGALRDDEVLGRLGDATRGPRPSSQTLRLLELVASMRRPAAAGGALDAPRCVRTHALAARSIAPSAVAFSPDGRLVLAATPDEEVLLLDVATGAVRTERATPAPCAERVTLDVERGLDLSTGGVVEGHVASGSLSVVSAPTSRRALSASWDRTVRLWDLDDGECLKTWSFEQRMSQVAWLPDETRAIAGGEGGLHVLDLETGAELSVANAGGWIKALAVSPDGRLCVAAVDPDRFDDRVSHTKVPALQLWELGPRARSFEPVRCVPRAAGDAERHASALAAHLDAARAALAARDAAGVHAALTAARALPGHSEDRDARELALTAAVQLDRTLVGPRAVWPLRSILLERVSRVALPAGSTLHALVDAPGGGARELHAIDLVTGRAERPVPFAGSLGLPEQAAAAIEGAPRAVAPQGRFALTSEGVEGERLSVWDVHARRRVASFEPRLRWESAALSPDGRVVLLGGGFDVALHVFDAATGRRLHQAPAYAWGVGAIRVSCDGRLAVTGGAGVREGGRPPAGRGYPDDDLGLRVLDLATGRFVLSIPDDGRGRDGGLTFELSHCGRWALATARDGLRLVDLATGSIARSLDLPRSPLLLAWNGRYAVSAAISDRELRVFELDWDFDPRARVTR